MEHNYLNYFPELKGMPPSKQMILLAEARYAAFRQPGMNLKMACIFIMTLLSACLVAVIPQFIWSEYYVRIIGMLVGILGGILLFRRLYAYLLRQGLQQVIEQRHYNKSLNK
jgi:Flp pilus assembly protein TadB